MKAFRRPGGWIAGIPSAQLALAALCTLAALYVVNHLAACSTHLTELRTSVRRCRDALAERPAVPPPAVAQPVLQPVVPTLAAASPSASLAGGTSRQLSEARAEISALKSQLERKQELLRVRSEQLVDVYDEVHEREALWGRAAERHADAKPPDLLAILAVVTEYRDGWLRDALRAEWYDAGAPASLERRIGVRAVFVLGANPDVGAGGAAARGDSAAVVAEAAAWPDLLRVPVVHTEGNDGKAALVHAMWRALPAAHDAAFYVKAQANALPNPDGVAAALRPRAAAAANASYIGCMKSGLVITDPKSPWFEPQSWKFGSGGGGARNYMLHAAANGYALSRAVALHVALNADLLALYSNEDVMVGSWLVGLNVEHIVDNAFCCQDTAACGRRGGAGRQSLAASEQQQGGGAACALHSGACNGVCSLKLGPAWDAVKACVRA